MAGIDTFGGYSLLDGQDWASGIGSSPSQPAARSSGGNWYDGLGDSLGSALGSVGTAASNFLLPYLSYQTQKDDRKFELQKMQQESILNTVEKEQQTGFVPNAVRSQSALPFLGNNSDMIKIAAVVAGIAAIALLVRK